LLTGLLLCSASPLARADDDPSLRGKKASEWVKQLLDDPKPARRQTALLALEALAPQTKRAMEGVVLAVRSEKDADVRKEVVRLLGRLDPMSQVAMQALADVLREDGDAGVRETAALGLGRLDRTASRAAVGVLVSALKDAAGPVRAASAEALGRLGADAAVGVDNLTVLLKDPETGPRIYACYALGQIGAASRPAVPEMARLLKSDPSLDVRRTAAKAFGLIGPDSADALTELGAVLVDEKAPVEVRQQVAASLTRLGGTLKPIAPQLAKALKDRDRTVRIEAIAAIDTMGKDAAVLIKDVIACLQLDGSAEVRLAAIGLLSRLGPEAREALPALELAEKDSSPAVRMAAREAVDKIKSAS
jgi:HEAT repeat protein